MLESIKLVRFRQHRNRTIHFSRNVTTIVGKNGTGKTGILCALRWLCFNQPRGKSFITWGEDSCAVILKVDGHKIVRRRGKKNTIQLDGKTYNLRDGYPPSLNDLLNLQPINFQNQFDSHFLLFQSAGQISKELNSIIDLEIIDQVLSDVAHEVRKNKTTVDVSKNRLQEATEKKKELAWVVDASETLYDLEEMEVKLQEKRDILRSLSQKLTKAQELATSIEKARIEKKQLDECVVLAAAVVENDKTVKRLTTLLEDLKRAQEAACHVVPSTEAMDKAYAQLVKCRKQYSRLNELLLEARRLEKSIWEAKKEKEKIEEQIRVEIGNKCPVCGKEMMGKK